MPRHVSIDETLDLSAFRSPTSFGLDQARVDDVDFVSGFGKDK